MAKTLRETIKETLRSHLKKKIGKVYGQCLNAVDWIEGTVQRLKAGVPDGPGNEYKAKSITSQEVCQRRCLLRRDSAL